MKKILALILALACSAEAQTYITVTAETNRAIRTNFSLVRSQIADLSGATFAISNITGLQTALDGKLATNGSAAGLTNFPAMSLTNVSGVLGLVSGGTGQTNAALAIQALLPDYTNNENKILALNSNATSLIWTTNAGGGTNAGIVDLADTTNGVTNTLGVANGGTGGTNSFTALRGLSVYNATYTNGITIGGTITNSNAIAIGFGAEARYRGSVVIGRSARNNGVATAVVIGQDAVGSGGVAIGFGATNTGGVAAIGTEAVITTGTWSVQIGKGTNTGSNNVWGTSYNNSTFQWLTNNIVEPQFQYLCNATATAGVLMTNTNKATIRAELELPLAALTNDSNVTMMRALSGSTNTSHPYSGSISVAGTNNTNTLVFSNGILQSVQ